MEELFRHAVQTAIGRLERAGVPRDEAVERVLVAVGGGGYASADKRKRKLAAAVEGGMGAADRGAKRGGGTLLRLPSESEVSELMRKHPFSSRQDAARVLVVSRELKRLTMEGGLSTENAIRTLISRVEGSGTTPPPLSQGMYSRKRNGGAEGMSPLKQEDPRHHHHYQRQQEGEVQQQQPRRKEEQQLHHHHHQQQQQQKSQQQQQHQGSQAPCSPPTARVLATLNPSPISCSDAAAPLSPGMGANSGVNQYPVRCLNKNHFCGGVTGDTMGFGGVRRKLDWERNSKLVMMGGQLAPCACNHNQFGDDDEAMDMDGMDCEEGSASSRDFKRLRREHSLLGHCSSGKRARDDDVGRIGDHQRRCL